MAKAKASKESAAAVMEALESYTEIAGSYNPAVIQDDLIRVHLKALSFQVNRNGFLHKRSVLEKSHTNAFGESVPAYKSFEKQLVNKNHLMRDSGAKDDTAIGFIERATMKDDGVYLDIVIWKRTLSESEQNQIRTGKVFVSMECEYDKPVVIRNGQEIAVDRAVRPSASTVRSMSEESTVSFVGLAILFDGVQPGDANSGVIYQENASLESLCVELSTEESTLTFDEDSNFVTKDNEETEMSKELLAQLEELKLALEAEKAARETAEATAQELQGQVEAKTAEVQAKGAELDDVYGKYNIAAQELQILKAKAFEANVSEWFDLEALTVESKSWLMGLLEWRCSDPDDFEEVACNIVAVAGCLKKTPSPKACAEGEDESSAESETPVAPEGEPAAPGEPAVEEAPAVEVVTEESAEKETAVPDAQAAGAPAEAPESATAEMTPQVEAAPIAGSPKKPKTWGIEHF